MINPVDVGAIRAPGAEVKEALVAGQYGLWFSWGLTDNITLEGFVQFEYEKSRIGDCGTFFSTVDYVADECGPVYALNSNSETFNRINSGCTHPGFSRMADVEPDDTDQFGLAMRWYVPELNETEFGFYYIQYHSRLPLVSGKTAEDTNNDGVITSTTEAIDPDTGAKYFIEYPEQIKLFGLSFNTTTPNGISIGGEYSYKKDVPIQLNSPDLVAAALGRGQRQQEETSIPQYSRIRVPDANGDGVTDISDAAASGFLGTVQQGYDRYDVSQLQIYRVFHSSIRSGELAVWPWLVKLARLTCMICHLLMRFVMVALIR